MATDGVNYYDQAARQSARRKIAKETAALVRTDVREDGDKARQQVRSSMDAVKECIRDDVKNLSNGARNPGGLKRKLVGKKVVAASPDHEMGEETYEIGGCTLPITVHGQFCKPYSVAHVKHGWTVAHLTMCVGRDCGNVLFETQLLLDGQFWQPYPVAHVKKSCLDSCSFDNLRWS